MYEHFEALRLKNLTYLLLTTLKQIEVIILNAACNISG